MAISHFITTPLEVVKENQQALLLTAFLLVLCIVNIRQIRSKKLSSPYKICSALFLCLAIACIYATLITPLNLESSRVSDLLAAADHQRKDRTPNVRDPKAVNPQDVCPGYQATHVTETKHGITAQLQLAGNPCNVYGRDVEDLTLIVETQDKDRLHVEILPTYVGRENYTWFILPEELIPKPKPLEGRVFSVEEADLVFSYKNNPSFSFTVRRRSTGDALFTTSGTKIVYEDQFVEFGSGLPKDYNLYGLGETMHAFRLGNDLTRKFIVGERGGSYK